MKLTRIAKVGALGAAVALALTACAANEPNGGGNNSSTEPTDGGSSLTGTLSATGASSMDAAQQAWTAAFQQLHNDEVTINYQATGSGTGRDNFDAGESDFIGSDRAYDLEEVEKAPWAGAGICSDAGIIEVPVYISPVAVIFNLEGIDSLNMTPQVIANVFNGTITNWNDPAIAADNPDAELPDLAISPVHRADDSGTTGTFTAYLAAVAPDEWPHEDSDTWPLTGGESAQQTAGVVAAVNGGNGTIGYADASQAGSLGTIAIGVQGEFVSYSADAASMLVENSPLAEGRGAGDLVFEVDPAAAPAGAYPIALVSYAIACETYEDTETADLVRAYFEYITSADGQDVAADAAGSAPLSESLRDLVADAVGLIS